MKIRIGNKLKSLRKSQRLSLSQLAESSGETHSKLASCLGIKLSELYEDVILDSKPVKVKDKTLEVTFKRGTCKKEASK